MRAPGESAGSPKTVTLPASGMTRPTMLRMSVLLPAPFGPSNPMHSPGFKSRETPSTAVSSPKRLISPSMRNGSDEDAIGGDEADAM